MVAAFSSPNHISSTSFTMSFKSVKGDKPRKYDVKKYGDNFDDIFRKDKPKSKEADSKHHQKRPV
jgi:hypothetical protein